MSTQKRTITKAEYYALCGLRELAIKADEQLQSYQKMVVSILQETNREGVPITDPGDGWSGEMIYIPRDTSVERVLKNLDVKVVEEE